VDEHGVAVRCARMDGALRACHDTVKHTIARSAVDAGFRVEVEVEVHGVFTRALCEADRRRMGAYSVREKQGLVPDLRLTALTTSSRFFSSSPPQPDGRGAALHVSKGRLGREQDLRWVPI
jgi:hypothetical protein